MLGKILLSLGGIIVAAGLFFLLIGKIGPGKLPGDIFIERENFSFYFPLATGLIISLIITVLLNLFFRR